MIAIRLLFVTAALLVAALWWRWEKSPLQWAPPAAIVPDATVFEVKNLEKDKTAQSTASYLAMLERPIFSSDRRPPPAIEEKPQPVVEVDVFSNLQLLGVLTGQEYTGVIVRENGKVKRIKVSDDLGGWQLQSVLERDAKFVRNGDTRVLTLVPVKVAPATAKVGDQINTPGAQSQSSVPLSTADLVAQENQKREEAKRENIRKRNALRTSAGLPPIFD